MTMVTDEWKIFGRSFGKKICLWNVQTPPPPPFNKMVVDNITTTATRHCLNDIWIHRSQKYFKKFPSVFSAVFKPRLSLPPPPRPLSNSQVDCIDLTLIYIDLRTLYTLILFLFLVSVSFYFSSEMTEYKWGMFCVNKRERDLWLLTRNIYHIFF